LLLTACDDGNQHGPGVATVLVGAHLDDPRFLQGLAPFTDRVSLQVGQPMTFRSELRYRGAPPTAEDVQELARKKKVRSLLRHLLPEHRQAIERDLLPVERAFAEFSRKKHLQDEFAMATLAGSEDEYPVAEDAAGKELATELAHRERQDKERALWVSRSAGKLRMHYRIDYARFPEIQKSIGEIQRHLDLAASLAEERTAQVLSAAGCAALDPATFVAAQEVAR
jgi:hypothetical protein